MDICFSNSTCDWPNPDGRVDMFDPAQFQIRSQDLTEAYHDAGQFYWELKKLGSLAFPFLDQGRRQSSCQGLVCRILILPKIGSRPKQ